MERLLRGAPTTFWGKLTRPDDPAGQGWHPLIDHCADVAACCEALLQRTLLRVRLANLGGLPDLTDGQVARLAALAALHDIGKFNHGFQNKAREHALPRAGHVAEALAFFGAPEAFQAAFFDAIDAATLATWADGEGSGYLLSASVAHHGRPVSTDERFGSELWRPAGGRDPIAGIADLARAARRWFPLAWEPQVPALPGGSAFQHAFSGLVTLADWLGSDVRFFPFSDSLDSDRITLARASAALAVERIGLDGRRAAATLGPARPTYAGVLPSGAAPRQAQAVVLDLPAEPGGSLTVLEAETGSGKTEAAMARYLRLLHAGEVDGLYFALPTRTAATQLFRRLVDICARVFADPDARPPVTLAVPGYLAVDHQDGRRLPGFRVLWNDRDDERFRYRGWAAENAKRYLAGAVVVGTIDQVLLSALATSHSHLRATSLLRQLLVVDEVHASDAYMARLLDEVLRRHTAAGGHALLMSATLGSVTRARVLADSRSAAPPSLADAVAYPYPVVTYRAAKGAAVVHAIFAPDRSRAVTVDLVPIQDDPVAIATAALDAAQAGARVLVLRNLVSDCIATQDALERLAKVRGTESLLLHCAGVAAPHHSRYATEDRAALDAAIEAAFGKNALAAGRVAVATQTVQQSLDLDADLMLTDLCPMDVLLQRLGRLHRHERPDRVRGYEQPRALLLVPADRDLGSAILTGGQNRGFARGAHGLGTVYDDLLVVEATWREVESSRVITIPADCRRLVERTTHPEALRAIAEELGDRWPSHWQAILGLRLADRGQAGVALANWSADFGENPTLFPSALDRRVQTRLGESDRRVVLEGQPLGPFDLPVAELAIPAWLARDLPTELEVADLKVSAGVLRFTLGEHDYTYDRLGLRLTQPEADPAIPEDGA